MIFGATTLVIAGLVHAPGQTMRSAWSAAEPVKLGEVGPLSPREDTRTVS
jgi:hypothetical protein